MCVSTWALRQASFAAVFFALRAAAFVPGGLVHPAHVRIPPAVSYRPGGHDFNVHHTRADARWMLAEPNADGDGTHTVGAESNSSVIFIDDVASCRKATEHIMVNLKNRERLAVALEGENLGRNGGAALLQVSIEDFSFDPSWEFGKTRLTYVFDIHTLQHQAFASPFEGGGGLQAVMETPSIQKVMYDVRAGCDALFHAYNVPLNNVVDVQVAFQLYRSRVIGAKKTTLKYTLGYFLNEAGVSGADKGMLRQVREKGARLLKPDEGGSPRAWAERPLHPDLLDYALANVRFLAPMAEHFVRPPKRPITAPEVSARFGRIKKVTNEKMRVMLESKGWERDAPIIYVDDIDSCRRATEEILHDLEQPRVAVDLKGEQLGREGSVALLQIAVESVRFDAGAGLAKAYPVYIFDTRRLPKRAFRPLLSGGGGLQDVFDSAGIEKIFYDVRPGCDALVNTYGVSLKNVVDLQVAYTLFRDVPNRTELTTFPQALRRFLKAADLGDADKDSVRSARRAGLELARPENGGNASLWLERPLRHELLEAAAADARLLIPMVDMFVRPPKRQISGEEVSRRLQRVKAMTKERIKRAAEGEEPCAGERMKLRDF